VTDIPPQKGWAAPPTSLKSATPRVLTIPVSPSLSTKKRAESQRSELPAGELLPPATGSRRSSTFSSSSRRSSSIYSANGKTPAATPGTVNAAAGTAAITASAARSKPALKLTEPQPFNLEVDKRAGVAAAEKFKTDISKEIEQEQALFQQFQQASPL
jgi:hypothetical protein